MDSGCWMTLRSVTPLVWLKWLNFSLWVFVVPFDGHFAKVLPAGYMVFWPKVFTIFERFREFLHHYVEFIILWPISMPYRFIFSRLAAQVGNEVGLVAVVKSDSCIGADAVEERLVKGAPEGEFEFFKHVLSS